MINIYTQWRMALYTYIYALIFYFLLTHTLNINKRAPLRIHNEMDILSNNDVGELSLIR